MQVRSSTMGTGPPMGLLDGESWGVSGPAADIAKVTIDPKQSWL